MKGYTLKDKSAIGMIDDKIQDNIVKNGISHFSPLLFAFFL